MDRGTLDLCRAASPDLDAEIAAWLGRVVGQDPVLDNPTDRALLAAGFIAGWAKGQAALVRRARGYLR